MQMSRATIEGGLDLAAHCWLTATAAPGPSAPVAEIASALVPPLSVCVSAPAAAAPAFWYLLHPCHLCFLPLLPPLRLCPRRLCVHPLFQHFVLPPHLHMHPAPASPVGPIYGSAHALAVALPAPPVFVSAMAALV